MAVTSLVTAGGERTKAVAFPSAVPTNAAAAPLVRLATAPAALVELRLFTVKDTLRVVVVWSSRRPTRSSGQEASGAEAPVNTTLEGLTDRAAPTEAARVDALMHVPVATEMDSVEETARQ